MGFYRVWDDVKKLDIDEKGFIDEYLTTSDKSIKDFESGKESEVAIICDVLINTKIGKLIDNIIVNKTNICAKDIPQYSNFENAIIGVNRILSFSEGPLSFEELGKKLVNSKSEVACKKYGENHAKVAQELSLVTIDKQGVNFVSNTSFGNLFLMLSDELKYKLAKRLLLRNKFIQLLINEAKCGECSYQKLAEEVLSTSTAIRRKSNCKYIIELILKNTSHENLLHNISW